MTAIFETAFGGLGDYQGGEVGDGAWDPRTQEPWSILWYAQRVMASEATCRAASRIRQDRRIPWRTRDSGVHLAELMAALSTATDQRHVPGA